MYDIPTQITSKESWPWYNDCGSFKKVKINQSFKSYSKLTSMAYMFYNLNGVTESEGFENIDTSNVTNMRQMFYNYAVNTTTVPDVSN